VTHLTEKPRHLAINATGPKVFASAIKDFFLHRWSKLAKSLTTRFADNFQIIKKPAF
jgi:hypothetical protein